MNMLINICRLLRLGHWIKNALVLLPPFFLGVIFVPSAMRSSAAAYLSFSFVASAVYIVNDLRDRDRDRQHPVKCHRPLACGRVSVSTACVLLVFLVLLGGGLIVFAHNRVLAAFVLFLYFALNVAYSLGLKNVPLVDIFILASGFVFRIFFGGFFTGVPISSWLFLCVFSSALFFACGKRLNELRRLGRDSPSRLVLRGYSERFLFANYYMFCVLTILFYCLWTISRTDQHAVGKLALTIPMMIFIVVRYNFLIESKDNDGDPVPILLHDKWLLVSSALFCLVNFVVLYFGRYLPRVSY